MNKGSKGLDRSHLVVWYYLLCLGYYSPTLFIYVITVHLELRNDYLIKERNK
jgi:hypothetical protein